MPVSQGRGIFVSYRRQDSSHLAGRLYDRLADRFGEGLVFMDVDAIEPGVDFAEEIDRAVERAAGTALIVTRGQTGEPIGIITDADISRAVADGKDPSDVRIYQLMTTRPTVISTTASIRDAARVMTSGHFRHLPVMGDAGLVGIVDITDVLNALLDVSEAGAEEPSSDP